MVCYLDIMDHVGHKLYDSNTTSNQRGSGLKAKMAILIDEINIFICMYLCYSFQNGLINLDIIVH